MTLLKPHQCQRCYRRFDTIQGLGRHETDCYPIRERPIRSRYAEKRIRKKIELANTRFTSGVEL